MAKAKVSISAEKVKEFSEAVDQAVRETETWMDLWNRVTGIGGTLAHLFPEQSERQAFMQTDEWKRYSAIVGERMGGSTEEMIKRTPEASGVVSVRLPRSLHGALKAEAEEEGVSLNQLILSKLALQLRTRLAA